MREEQLDLPAPVEDAPVAATPVRRDDNFDARRALLALALALAVVLGGFNLGRAFFGPLKGQDIAPYYVSSHVLVDGRPDLVYAGGRAYQGAAHYYHVPTLRKGEADLGIEANVYPPTTTVLYAPLTLFPYVAARIVFFLISLAVAAAASVLLFWDRARPERRTLLTISLLAAACFFPLWYTLYEGQVNCLLWVLAVGGLALLRKDRPVAGGAAIGVAALIKLFPAVLLVFLLVKRELRAFAAAVGAAAVAVAVALPVTGTRLWSTYLNDVLPHQASGGANYRNQGFEGFFDRLLTRNGIVASFGAHGTLATTLTIACGVALVAAAAWIARRPAPRRSDRYALEYALFLAVAVVCAPKSWEHYAVLLLPGFALAFVALFGPGRRVRPLSLATAVALSVSCVAWAFLLQTGSDYASLPHGRVANLLFSLKFLASLILIGCLGILIRREAISARSSERRPAPYARAA